MQAYSPRSGSQGTPEKMERPHYLYDLGKDPSSQPSTSFWLLRESLGLWQTKLQSLLFSPHSLTAHLMILICLLQCAYWIQRPPPSSVTSSQSLPHLSLRDPTLEVALTLEGHYVNPLHRVSRLGAGSQLRRRQGKLGEIIMIRGGWSQSGGFWRKQLC